MTKTVKNVQYKVWAGLGWDNTPVKVTLPCVTVAEANTAARQLSQACDAEIRWNWEGEDEGHFISATYALKLQPHRLTPEHADAIIADTFYKAGYGELTRADYDYTDAIPESAEETRLLDAIFGKRKVDAGASALTPEKWDWDKVDYTVQVCKPTTPEAQDEGKFASQWAKPDGEPRFSAVERAEADLVWYNAGYTDGQADECKRGKADATPTSHRVTLTIPSISDGHKIVCELRRKNLQYARTDISIAFGGYTSYDAEGGWVDDDGELVTERVTVIETFTGKPVDFITDTLTTLAERLAVSLKQDCVLWTLDNAPNFVFQPEAH